MKLKDGDYQQWVAESQMGNTDFKSQFFKGAGVGGALAAMPANFDTFSKPLPEWAAVKPPARDGTDPTATLPDAGQAKGSNAPIGDGSLGGGVAQATEAAGQAKRRQIGVESLRTNAYSEQSRGLASAKATVTSAIIEATRVVHAQNLTERDDLFKNTVAARLKLCLIMMGLKYQDEKTPIDVASGEVLLEAGVWKGPEENHSALQEALSQMTFKPLPDEDAASLTTNSAVHLLIEGIRTKTTEDDIKAAAAHTDDKIKLMVEVCKSLRRASADLKSNVAKRERDEQKAKERQEKKESQKTGAQKRNHTGRNPGAKIAQLDFSEHTTIAEFSMTSDLEAAERPYDMPFIIRQCDTFKKSIAANMPLQKTLGMFASQFMASAACKQTGTTQCPIPEKQGLEDAMIAFQNVLDMATKSGGPQILTKVATVDGFQGLKQCMKTVWLVGWDPSFMEVRAGTESHQVAAVRFISSGDLFVACVPARLVQEAMRLDCQDPHAVFTLELLVGWMQNLLQNALDTFAKQCKQKVCVGHVCVGASSTHQAATSPYMCQLPKPRSSPCGGAPSWHQMPATTTTRRCRSQQSSLTSSA